ncbi:MAG: GntR family transcriptional regulator [Acidobacteria bacterium]|nr:GntR family transcriptional regulator [Acidobacteriota bacterium]
MSGASPKSIPFAFRLDLASGVPVYRQLIEQVRNGIALGSLRSGDQLPTVRQTAVDLAINPNTVVRAYRELEILGTIETHQGTGTFVSSQKVDRDDVERQRQLNQIVSDFVARAAAAGFGVEDILARLNEVSERKSQ